MQTYTHTWKILALATGALVWLPACGGSQRQLNTAAPANYQSDQVTADSMYDDPYDRKDPAEPRPTPEPPKVSPDARALEIARAQAAVEAGEAPAPAGGYLVRADEVEAPSRAALPEATPPVVGLRPAQLERDAEQLSGVYVDREDEAIVIQMPALFLPGEDQIRPARQPLLRGLAKLAEDHRGYAMLVVGHTDKEGSPHENLTLGQARAASVKTFLVGQGVVPWRMSVLSEGSGEPLATRDDRYGEAVNRRVEIRFVPPEVLDISEVRADDGYSMNRR